MKLDEFPLSFWQIEVLGFEEDVAKSMDIA